MSKLLKFPIICFLVFQLGVAQKETSPPKKPPTDVSFVLSARGLPDTDELDLGSPDPYVEVSYFDATGSKNASFINRTRALDNNHNPDWDEMFHVKHYEGRGQRLKFRVMDYDTLVKDDEIGVVEVRLRELVEAKGSVLTRPIIGHRKQNGKLIIRVKIGDKITEETDTRLFKQPIDQVHLEKQKHYIIIVAEY